MAQLVSKLSTPQVQPKITKFSSRPNRSYPRLRTRSTRPKSERCKSSRDVVKTRNKIDKVGVGREEAASFGSF